MCNRLPSPVLAEIERPITKILPRHFVTFDRFLEGICMFTKHVGYMGNSLGDFFKQWNMYCGKSALLKGQKTGVILQEKCAICTWGCNFTFFRCNFT